MKKTKNITSMVVIPHALKKYKRKLTIKNKKHSPQEVIKILKRNISAVYDVKFRDSIFLIEVTEKKGRYAIYFHNSRLGWNPNNKFESFLRVETLSYAQNLTNFIDVANKHIKKKK